MKKEAGAITMTQFVAMLRDVAKEQPHPVLAVDFGPGPKGPIQVTFRFKSEV